MVCNDTGSGMLHVWAKMKKSKWMLDVTDRHDWLLTFSRRQFGMNTESGQDRINRKTNEMSARHSPPKL